MAEQIDTIKAELDDWRTKALDVERHPAVKILLKERDDALARLVEIRRLSTGWRHGQEGAHLLRINSLTEDLSPSSRTDSAMLDWLEQFVNEYGALVLHDGNQDVGRHYGLGLRPGATSRTLRQAIAQAMGDQRIDA